MEYKANFRANNGTGNMKPYTGTNKALLTKLIRRKAESERFEGNEARWWVYDTEGYIINAGKILRNGKHIIQHEVIGNPLI